MQLINNTNLFLIFSYLLLKLHKVNENLARNIFILNSFIKTFIQNMQEIVLLETLNLVFTFNNNLCLPKVLKLPFLHGLSYLSKTEYN